MTEPKENTLQGTDEALKRITDGIHDGVYEAIVQATCDIPTESKELPAQKQ